MQALNSEDSDSLWEKKIMDINMKTYIPSPTGCGSNRHSEENEVEKPSPAHWSPGFRGWFTLGETGMSLWGQHTGSQKEGQTHSGRDMKQEECPGQEQPGSSCTERGSPTVLCVPTVSIPGPEPSRACATQMTMFCFLIIKNDQEGLSTRTTKMLQALSY